MLSFMTITGHQSPQFIGIKFPTEEKMPLAEVKNIKGGEIKVGAEVVVGFNGEDEKAEVVVLSAYCS